MLSLILSSVFLAPPGPPTALPNGGPHTHCYEDLASVQADYERAVSAWEEACEGIRSKRKRPPHPCIEFLPRYRALTEGGTAAAIPWIVEHAKEAGVKLIERRTLVPELLTHAFEEHAHEVWLEEALFALLDSRKLLEPEQAVTWCTNAAASSPHDAVRAAALFTWAGILSNEGRSKDENMLRESAALLLRAAHECPGSTGADLALGIAFDRLDDEWRDALRSGGRGPGARPADGASAPSRPADPGARFWGRFGQLADLGSGHARLWMLTHIQASGLGGAEIKQLKLSMMEELTTSFANAPWLLELAPSAAEVGKPDALEEVCGILSRWADNVESREDQARVFLGLARAYFEAGNKNEAIDLLKKIQRYHADTELAWEAEDMMGTYTAPRVGEEAPAFTTTDVDGNELVLSEQRGKVVLLDFWGFW